MVKKRYGKFGKPREAFTLIELLVVIAIIALLASVLVPSLSNISSSARSVVCVTRLRGIGLASTLYADDFNGTMMTYAGVEDSPGHFSGYFWLALKSYGLESTDSYSCPEKDPIDTSSDWNHYGVNLWFYRAYAPGQSGWQVYQREVLHPRSVAYYADTHPPMPGLDARVVYPPANLGSIDRVQMNFGDRHNNKANILWCDGHIDAQTAEWFWDECSNTYLDWGDFQ